MGVLLFFFGTFIGVTVVSGFMNLVKFTVNKAFGRNVVLFRFMNVFYREHSGFSHIGFSPVCELEMRKDEDTDRSVIAAFVIEMTINVLACAAYNVFMVRLWTDKNADERIIAFLLGIGAWFVLFLIVNFICLYTALKRRFSEVNKQRAEIHDKMRDGLSFDDIDVPDYKMMDSRATKSNIVNYLVIAFIKKLWDDDIAGAGEIIHSQETALKINYVDMPKEYLIAWSRAYYDLLYYYSAVCLNKSRADYFYDMLKDQLHSDMDADAQRILAAYYFYVRNDIVTAERCAFRAEEAAHDCKTRAERLIEDKLIKKLIADIHEKKKYLESLRAAL